MNSKLLYSPALLLLTLSTNAAEMPLPETGYSAVRTIEAQGSSFQTTVYYEDSKERSEMNMNGQSMVTIMRPDLGVLWMLMPGGIYMEQPLDLSNPSMSPGQMPQTPTFTDASQIVEFTEEGREEINGFSTTRYRMRAENTDGSVVAGQIWLTEDNIAVQTRMSVESGAQTGEILISLQDLKIGDQPDNLFEIPAGYQQFNVSGIPGAAFGDADRASNPDDPSFADELTDAVQEGVEDALVEETQRGVRDAVSRRLRGLFDRD